MSVSGGRRGVCRGGGPSTTGTEEMRIHTLGRPMTPRPYRHDSHMNVPSRVPTPVLTKTHKGGTVGGK